jgi:PPOX class probable F420-dependent enzyme
MAVVETQVRRRPRLQIRGKYLSLTSYRRDGSPVATPVWFVADEERLYAITSADSYKAKRIRRNPSVAVAECTARGELRGEPIPAQAEFLPEHEHARIDRMMAEKYRIDRILILPIYRLVMKLRRKPAFAGEEAYLAITPTAQP